MEQTVRRNAFRQTAGGATLARPAAVRFPAADRYSDSIYAAVLRIMPPVGVPGLFSYCCSMIPLGFVSMMPGNPSERHCFPSLPDSLPCFLPLAAPTDFFFPASFNARRECRPATPGSVQNFTDGLAALERKPYLLHTLITSRLKIFVFPLQYLSLCGIISEEGAATASVPPCGATPQIAPQSHFNGALQTASHNRIPIR